MPISKKYKNKSTLIILSKDKNCLVSHCISFYNFLHTHTHTHVRMDISLIEIQLFVTQSFKFLSYIFPWQYNFYLVYYLINP